MKRLLILGFLLLALTAASSAYAVVTVVRQQHHQNDALHLIICRAEHVVRKTPLSVRYTADERRRAIRFYQGAIKSAHLKPCS